LLFAVIRGSLSEGINFSDKLGRCVVVVGLPYLSVRDPEVIAKKAYYDKSSWYSGYRFYENSCDVAIKQSIGRAIRHVNHYAVVLLVDSRHDQKIHCRPDWMKRNKICGKTTKEVLEKIRKFFKSK
jgi:chromosome transmission fidelity protein 1